MAIVQVTLKQQYLGKDIYNVFHYLNLTNAGFGLAWMTGLVSSFSTFVVPKINAIQVDGVTNVSLTAVQVENANLQTQLGLSGAGAIDVENTFFLPAAQTYAFRLFVSPSYDGQTGFLYNGNRRITDGYKRFTGVSDGLIVNGNWLSSWAEGADVDTLEEALATNLITGVSGAALANPIVYGRPIQQKGLPGEPGYAPARIPLFAYITSANLQTPRWTRGRQA